MGINRVDFFVQTAKHCRIAGFQAYDLGTALRVFDEQIVDCLLGGRGAEAFLADIDHQRFAARKLEDLGADQAVIDHHVGLVQGAAGFQCQKFRITGATTDKGDVTGARRTGQVIGQQVIKRFADCRFAVSHSTGASVEIIVAPEIAARATKGQGVCHLAKPFADARQRTQCCGQAFLQVGLDRAGQHGGGPFGADGDGDGITVNNSGRDKGAVVQVIDDIDQRTLGPCDGGGAGVFHGIFVSGVEQFRA